MENGRILFRQHKTLLPSYDVFDETRYFETSVSVDVFPYRGETLGIMVCEDAWNDAELWPKKMYPVDPVAVLAGKGATILINLSASPYSVGKENVRYNLLRNHARRHGLPFVLVNQVGGNDELVFDGASLAVDRSGTPVALLPRFREAIHTLDLGISAPGLAFSPLDPVVSMFDALTFGLRDYMQKCGFHKAVLGLSGGIDSALVACLAAAALGPENVLGVAMPSMHSSAGSIEDAEILARRLGIRFETIQITDVYRTFRKALDPGFRDTPDGIAEENLQARIRGTLLMAFSNKFGYLTLSTGNKSELSVGYCTLYGDMSGGLSVIADVPKTWVYKLARYVNLEREIIPGRCFTKPPSAELRPGQMDQDSLPPYDVLDAILECYLEHGCPREEIVRRGFEPATVDWVIRAVNLSEYKRRQAAPGIKLFTKSFGMGRRMPIAAKYTEWNADAAPAVDR
jgi:NAD+ synthase (glutamine-hydrolysing)